MIRDIAFHGPGYPWPSCLIAFDHGQSPPRRVDARLTCGAVTWRNGDRWNLWVEGWDWCEFADGLERVKAMRPACSQVSGPPGFCHGGAYPSGIEESTRRALLAARWPLPPHPARAVRRLILAGLPPAPVDPQTEALGAAIQKMQRARL